MLGDLMTSVQPIEIKIFGDDPQKLHDLSKQVSSIVENVKGTADVFDGIVIAGPSLTVIPDFKKIAQYGITPANLQFQVQTALEGNVAGNIFEKNSGVSHQAGLSRKQKQDFGRIEKPKNIFT